jgi:predicted RNA binding protein YcfA (HicA-like mRNA interferase family)
VKMPRDVSGADLARALAQFGYQISRQSGSHMRLTSTLKGTEHHITIPAHTSLKVGTLAQILTDVSAYLDISRQQLMDILFS